MSKYTSGELAKLCGVSVRTVQYYDGRGILTPTALSEGGRRLYSESDLSRLKIICFLRGLELPIDSIKDLFSQEQPERVIDLLLDQQEQDLRREIEEKQQRVETIGQVKRTLRRMSQFSAQSIGDIAHIIENKKRMRRLYINMVIIGIIMDAIQIGTLLLWIFRGVWLPFALGEALVLALGVYVSLLYFRRTVYICPECHSVFRPRFRESFFARHTPYTRKLSCPHCSYHGFCVETYGKDDKSCSE